MVLRAVCVALLAAAAAAVPQESALPGAPAYKPLPVGDVVPEVRSMAVPSMAVRLRMRPRALNSGPAGSAALRLAPLSACA